MATSQESLEPGGQSQRPTASRLLTVLEETPVDDVRMWRAAMGAVPDASTPQLIQSLAAACAAGRAGTSVLVHGVYGVGKSSFMRALQGRIKELDSGAVCCWLHMPVLTAAVPCSALPIVMASMVDELKQNASKQNAEEVDEELTDLLKVIDNLERIEGVEREDVDGGVPFRPARLAPGTIDAHRAANTVERAIESLLKERGWRLNVFVDDLDRCPRSIAVDIVKLLLRFHGMTRVSIVIACDREVLEDAVDSWMGSFGHGEDGRPTITANSALVKYLHHFVAIPELSQEVHPSYLGEHAGVLGELQGELVELLDETLERAPEGVSGDVRLIDVFFHDVLRTVGREELRIERVPVEPNLDVDLEELVQAQREPNQEASLPAFPGEIATMEGELVPGGESDNGDLKKSDHGTLEKSEYGALKKSEHVASKDADFLATSTSLLEFLQRVLWCLDDGKYRVRDEFLGLARNLTLRQLKFLVREYYLGSSQERPEATLLQSLFRPVWQMREHEPELYSMLEATAVRLLHRSGARASRLDGLDLKTFESQLRRVTKMSLSLEEDGMQRCWPARRMERELLVNVLHALSVGASRGRRSPGDGASLSGAASVGKDLPDFVSWVEERVGASPLGFSIASRVSSFQDLLLQQVADPEQRWLHVAAYHDTFLEAHRRDFTRATATTISNLAVVIDDAPSLEPQCDELFRLAQELDPSEARIALYHVDFLRDVLGERGRLQHLLESEHYESAEAVVAHARKVLSRRMGDEHNRLHARTLEYCLNVFEEVGGRSGSDSLILRLGFEMIREIKPTLITTAQSGDSENIYRVSAALSWAAENATNKLRVVTLGGCVMWGFAEEAGAPTWAPRLQVANKAVAESRTRSEDERCGMGLNRGLLLDPQCLERASSSRLAAIWSQSAIVVRFLPKTADTQRRVALALGLGLIYADGLNHQFAQRLTKAFPAEGGNPEDSLHQVMALVRANHAELHQSVLQAPRDTSRIEPACDEVFADDFPRIDTLSQFMDRNRWSPEDRALLRATLDDQEATGE
ncbi:MAG: P-loop NTPase fold protein [Acidobacteriota bacterium]